MKTLVFCNLVELMQTRPGFLARMHVTDAAPLDYIPKAAQSSQGNNRDHGLEIASALISKITEHMRVITTQDFPIQLIDGMPKFALCNARHARVAQILT